MFSVIIIGLGSAGLCFTEGFLNAGYKVTVIDKNPEIIAKFQDAYDLIGFTLSCSDIDALLQVDFSSADIVICTTDNDALNIVTCQNLAHCSGTIIKLARTRSLHYTKQLHKQSLVDHVISPEKDIAKALSCFIQANGCTDVVRIPEQGYLVGFNVMKSAPVLGQSLEYIKNICHSQDLELVCMARNRCILLEKDKQHDSIIAGDVLYFWLDDLCVPHRSWLLNLLSIRYIHEDCSVAIVGGGYIARQLANMLLRMEHVKTICIIEKDKDRIEYLYNSFEPDGSMMHAKIKLLHADAMDQVAINEILGHNEITHLFCLMDKNESNIVASILAKSYLKDIWTYVLINRLHLDHLERFIDVPFHGAYATIPALINTLGLYTKHAVWADYKLVQADAHCLLVNIKQDVQIRTYETCQELGLRLKCKIVAHLKDGIRAQTDVLAYGDTIACVVPKSSLKKFKKHFNCPIFLEAV